MNSLGSRMQLQKKRNEEKEVVKAKGRKRKLQNRGKKNNKRN